jgi:hypothetical protein
MKHRILLTTALLGALALYVGMARADATQPVTAAPATGKQPTQADVDALNKKIADLQVKLAKATAAANVMQQKFIAAENEAIAAEEQLVTLMPAAPAAQSTPTPEPKAQLPSP